MEWNLTALSLFSFLAAGVLAALVGVVWRRQNDSRAFTALIAAVFFWSVVYGIQLGFEGEQAQLLWQRVTLVTSGLVPMMFLFFAFEYAGRENQLTQVVTAVLTAEWFLFSVLTVSNPIHHLIWTRATLTTQLFSPVLDVEFALGYQIHILFAYLVVTAGFWAVLSVYFRSAGIYRKQSSLILVGAVPAFISHVLYTVKASPVPGLDLTPFVFSFTGIVYGLALFHFDLLERTPVARQRAMELTGDGLIVVDESGHVVDSNRIARHLYDIDHSETSHISTVLGEMDVRHLHGTTTLGTIDGTQRVYELYITELASESGPNAGFAVVLRDVTDQNAYEQRLVVTNRVLRHNLRNDMNVIMGYADTLAASASSPEERNRADVISATAERLVELSEKARQIADIDKNTPTAAEPVDVVSVVETLLDEYREQNPTVTVTSTFSASEAPVFVSKQALRITLQNLLENTVEHNDTETLAVDVTVTVTDTQTLVTVSDNGVGLPKMEQAVLESDTETPLQHSNGLGLWLTSWVVSAVGGEITVEASESSGTTVSLQFPKQVQVPNAQLQMN
ncbi:histidine kinase N-terminal 7TM domain-containing protein [Haloferax sp. DFSO52]|uniref:histidine kinase N-terminal 7TM domain-containing protein n=1 Tax=Haloferax sp. DFSO52 TaxID=3388505 RepID=UPI003A892FF5